MKFPISIIINDESVPAELNDTETAHEILNHLPIESEFSTWGDEIYFSIPVKMGLQNGRDVVEKGVVFRDIVETHINSGSKEPLNIQAMFFSYTMDR